MRIMVDLKKYVRSGYKISLSVFNCRLISIISIPLSLFFAFVLVMLTPLLNKLLRSKTYVFNMSALGHDVSEFIEFVNQLDSENSSERIRLLFRYNHRRPTNNLFIFEIWRRRLKDLQGVTIHNTPSVLWCIILYQIQYNQRSNTWLNPLTPNFSTYKSMTKSQFSSLIKVGEQQKLNNLLSQTIQSPPNTYCVLGIRDSTFYNDHSIRSSTIDDYLPSIEMLLELEIPIIRMGRRMLGKVPIKHSLLFDYSFSEHVNDENDVLLWSNARFAFGDSTGLTGVVGSFGSPIFMPTVPLDPRAFVSHELVYFATQSLLDMHQKKLEIMEIVSLMNKGFNLGDERILESLGLKSVRNSPMVIRESLEWFLDVALNRVNSSIEYTRATQNKLTDFMASFDEDVFRHYRKDVLYSESWNSMASSMWPQSVNSLIATDMG